MSYLLAILKAIGGPGSLGFLAVGLVASYGLARMWPRRRMLPYAWAGALLAAYAALATPVAAVFLVTSLPLVPEPSNDALRATRTLVVFDGDNRQGRRRRARQVVQLASPAAVWLLGADYLRADLRVVLPPATALHYDRTTWNTHAQVVRVQEIAKGAPAASIAVIASTVQMPRIAAQLAGTSPVLLVPSPLDRQLPATGTGRLVPSYAALLVSRDAVYEHAALRYYRWRGDLQ